eukprot:Em0007g284a
MEASEATAVQGYDPSQLRELLQVYYTWLFPYDRYFQWLQYGDIGTFSHREFSFTLPGDIYVRYKSFESQEEFERELKKDMPEKIDIGAVFSVQPSRHKKVPPANFKPVQKELVFDIDMTDYDEIRTCCKEANICNKCWKFITVAMKTVDRALREDFGYKHILWVYSGRRGVHCWVCDREARFLNQESRVAVVEYLTLIKGGEHQVQKVKLPNHLHPSISSALNIIKHDFNTLMVEQDFLGTRDQCSKILSFFKDEKKKQELVAEFETQRYSSDTKWSRLVTDLKQQEHVNEVMLQWAYPRLDVNVTKGINHLLKSPFCIHPKTGRVCVPIDFKHLDTFDPMSVPTVSDLCQQLEKIEVGGEEKSRRLMYMKTSLQPYMSYFVRCFLNPLLQSLGTTARGEPTMEF